MSDYVANHAREDWYQPGSLIRAPLADIIDADFNGAITGSWEDIHDSGGGDLHIAYTPPINCHVEVRLSITLSISAANSPVVIGLFNGGTGLKNTWCYPVINNAYVSQVVIWDGPLTANTAYDFIAKYYIITGGVTIKVLAPPEDTIMVLKAWAQP